MNSCVFGQVAVQNQKLAYHPEPETPPVLPDIKGARTLKRTKRKEALDPNWPLQEKVWVIKKNGKIVG